MKKLDAMTPKRLLIANRGEIAVRIVRAAVELGIETVAIFSEDDARSLHVARADESRALRGSGPRAYLDAGQIVRVANDAGCDAVHPGYGFLAESADFARRCAAAGVTFVGPRPETLELLGDKSEARALAERCGVPVLPGTRGAATLEDARRFFRALAAGDAMVIKAIAGGGGRGMRVVATLAALDAAYQRCRSEALAAFGNGDVYVERLMPRARHVEVQIVGDGSGAVASLGDRDCSVQRRHQKLLELAPAPSLPARLRDRLTDAALRLAREVRFASLGTFEFLVDASAAADASRDAAATRDAAGHLGGDAAAGGGAPFAFIEANPRLQVEHTVTEAVTGLDLVQIQLRLAGGATLAALGLTQPEIPEPRGIALQARVNTETIDAAGTVRPSSGVITAFDPPTGPGIRVDTCAYAGWATSPRFDSLLAKVIAHTSSAELADASRGRGVPSTSFASRASRPTSRSSATCWRIRRRGRGAAHALHRGARGRARERRRRRGAPAPLHERSARRGEPRRADGARSTGAPRRRARRRSRPRHPALQARASTRSIRSPSWRTARRPATRPRPRSRGRRRSQTQRPRSRTSAATTARSRCARRCKEPSSPSTSPRATSSTPARSFS